MFTKKTTKNTTTSISYEIFLECLLSQTECSKSRPATWHHCGPEYRTHGSAGIWGLLSPALWLAGGLPLQPPCLLSVYQTELGSSPASNMTNELNLVICASLLQLPQM